MTRVHIYDESDIIFLRLTKAMKDVGVEVFRECIKGCCPNSEQKIQENIISGSGHKAYTDQEKEKARQWNLFDFDITIMHKILKNELHSSAEELRTFLKNIKNERNELFHKIDGFTNSFFEEKMQLYVKFYLSALNSAIDVAIIVLEEIGAKGEGLENKKKSLRRMETMRNALQNKINDIQYAGIEIKSADMEKIQTERLASAGIRLASSTPTLSSMNSMPAGLFNRSKKKNKPEMNKLKTKSRKPSSRKNEGKLGGKLMSDVFFADEDNKKEKHLSKSIKMDVSVINKFQSEQEEQEVDRILDKVVEQSEEEEVDEGMDSSFMQSLVYFIPPSVKKR